MITLESLVSDYGHSVDHELIAAIWAEQEGDGSKCRDIVRMLSSCSDWSDVTTTACAEGSEHGLIDPASSRQSTHSGSSALSTVTHPNPHLSPKVEPSTENIIAITSPKALLGFLTECFPECGTDYLNTKVEEIFCDQDRASFQVDPIEAIEIISNAFYNDSEAVSVLEYQHTHSKPESAQTSQPGSCSDSSISSKNNGARSGGAKDPRAGAGLLAAIEQQYAVPSAKGKAGRGRKRLKGAGKGRGDQSLPAQRSATIAQLGRSTNAWSAIGTELEAICAMFPMLAVATVKSTYHACAADSVKAVEKLSAMAALSECTGSAQLPVTELESPNPPNVRELTKVEKKTLQRTVDSLQMLFPDHPRSLLEQAAQETHDVDAAAERALVLVEEKSYSNVAATARKNTKSTKWRAADELAHYRVAPFKNASARVGDEDIVHDPMEQIPLSEISGSARLWITEHPADPAYCRKKAAAYVQKRNELYTKAAYAYTRRNNLHHSCGTALFYSTEGHSYDARARIWRMRAAQASVAAMKRNNAEIVDLHGLTRAEAVAIVQDAVNAWHSSVLAAEKGVARSRPLHIVTGLGNHSIGHKACIHPSIVRILRNGNWNFEEGDGYVNVLGTRRGSGS
ncbi:hypothetical protein H4R24_000468 [Coemansia sp. RSA 988]|nr:hypothetical protein H4R24_000468 [Coemansia sp. RSA 988]